jgi:hypothetical protein
MFGATLALGRIQEIVRVNLDFEAREEGFSRWRGCDARIVCRMQDMRADPAAE